MWKKMTVARGYKYSKSDDSTYKHSRLEDLTKSDVL